MRGHSLLTRDIRIHEGSEDDVGVRINVCVDDAGRLVDLRRNEAEDKAGVTQNIDHDIDSFARGLCTAWWFGLLGPSFFGGPRSCRRVENVQVRRILLTPCARVYRLS